MKTTLLFAALPLLAASAFGAGATSSSSSSRDAVSVEFIEPETYTDSKRTETGSAEERRALADRFRTSIQRVAERYIPPGYHLDLRFRDIDMAGAFEPQAGPNYADVRIVRGIYPPSFLVEYTLTNDAGDVVQSGQRRMTDLAFQNIVTFRNDRPLFYETELVVDLLRDLTRSL